MNTGLRSTDLEPCTPNPKPEAQNQNPMEPTSKEPAAQGDPQPEFFEIRRGSPEKRLDLLLLVCLRVFLGGLFVCLFSLLCVCCCLCVCECVRVF